MIHVTWCVLVMDWREGGEEFKKIASFLKIPFATIMPPHKIKTQPNSQHDVSGTSDRHKQER